MVYHKISPDMKQRALQLIDEGWEMQDVMDILSVASKSIRQWADNYDTHGCVNPPSVLSGCPCLLNSKAISDLQELICETPTLFLDEISEWLALYHDQPILTTALHDNLQELGLTHKILQKAAVEYDDLAWAEWLTHFISNYMAHQMVVLDESSKDGQSQALAGNGKTVLESLSVLVAKFSALEDLVLPAEEGFSVGYTNKEFFLPCSATGLIVCSSSPHKNEELSSSPHKPASDSEDDIDGVP